MYRCTGLWVQCIICTYEFELCSQHCRPIFIWSREEHPFISNARRCSASAAVSTWSDDIVSLAEEFTHLTQTISHFQSWNTNQGLSKSIWSSQPVDKWKQLGRLGGGLLFYCQIWHLCPSTTAAVQKSQWEMTGMNICFHIWKYAQYPDFIIPYLHVEILALETLFLLHQSTMARQLAAGLAISVMFLTRKGSVFCLHICFVLQGLPIASMLLQLCPFQALWNYDHQAINAVFFVWSLF